MYQTIVTEIDAGVGIVTLNRPAQHNAMDEVLLAELSEAMGMMSAEPAVRVVVVSSTGKCFCAGSDRSWLQRSMQQSAEQNLQQRRAMAELLYRIAHAPKPVIARVQGAAYGIGVGLMAASDIVLTTFDTRFAVSDVRLGLLPAVISPYLIAAIGQRHARRYLLSGERFSAAEAYRIGLVHEMVVDEAALDEAVGDTVDTILSNSSQAMRDCKELMAAVVGQPLRPELIDDTARRAVSTDAGAEAREGVAAYVQQRSPD